jgi:3-deoxy-7-phosphoheptulonate synthase
MRTEATQAHIAAVVERVEEQGLRAHISRGAERTIIGAIGDGRPIQRDQYILMPGVDRVVPISRSYKLASREFHPEDSAFPLDGLQVNPGQVLLIAGPCSVESREQIIEAAHAVREAGAHALRGGAFKPRTSPYSFQGLGAGGLEMLAEARAQTGLPIVTEVMAPDQVDLVSEYADVLQIGARNMQNYALLHAVGEKCVMLCERGIRTFETATRNTTDINAVPVLKSLTHLPVVLDPSHGTGHWEYVNAISRAAIAAGADGLIIEVHPNPEKALSDGGQSLKPERFAELVDQVKLIAEATGRQLNPQPAPVVAQ